MVNKFSRFLNELITLSYKPLYECQIIYYEILKYLAVLHFYFLILSFLIVILYGQLPDLHLLNEGKT